VLLQSGYSRTMEREADDHAWRSLNESCIAPQRFADILRRLDRHPSETGLLDSHPGTAERIRQFNHPSVC
jgi:Zn-dependent protease with chaperone function